MQDLEKSILSVISTFTSENRYLFNKEIIDKLMTCLHDTTIFQIVESLRDVQQLEEKRMYSKRKESINKCINEKKSKKDIVSHIQKVDAEIITDLDKKLSEQQSILERTGIPFFRITNDYDEIKLQKAILDLIIKLQKFVNYAARQRRYRTTLPMNTIFLFVPTQEAWIIERFGKFKTILQPGLNIIYPIIDKIKYVQNLKEMAISIPQQSAITKDNVTVRIDGILYVKVSDPYLACYGVDDPEFAITQLAQTTMRSEIGKISLDSLFRERESLNATIVGIFIIFYNINVILESINKASTSWGLDCKRYEIRDIDLPVKVQEAMQTQVEAERKKRASILESEGVRDSQINIANGKREAVILSSEAYKIEQINRAEGYLF
ncbi:hypothetical protein A3Q56_06207 [Intoshia linei]|uniref:Band 7 domain-containing protein n=1 Tax=Intoshia linei TaxID=1819745 RepID=A0A177AVN1_9BILA|nr:hypothetical protein A3Q56_06207 [Intoshia linei]